MIRRIAIAILAVVFLGLAGFLLLSWRRAIPPIERPAPESFSAGSIARGEALAAAGHCASCHTRPGGQSFAGGYGVNTPFGIVYETKITPDPKTGIGTLEFHQISHRGRKLPEEAEEFSAFLKKYIAVWAGEGGIL